MESFQTKSEYRAKTNCVRRDDQLKIHMRAFRAIKKNDPFDRVSGLIVHARVRVDFEPK